KSFGGTWSRRSSWVISPRALSQAFSQASLSVCWKSPLTSKVWTTRSGSADGGGAGGTFFARERLAVTTRTGGAGGAGATTTGGSGSGVTTTDRKNPGTTVRVTTTRPS